MANQHFKAMRLPGASWWILAALAAVPPLALLLGEPFLLRVFTRVVLLAMVAVALNLVLGFGGLVSLMHAALFGVGGYVVAVLAHHAFNGDLFLGLLPGTLSLALSLPLSMLASATVALLTGYVALRTSGAFFIMITLAFNQMLFYFFVALRTYGGEDGLQILGTVTLFGLDASKRVPFFYLCLAALGLTVWVLGRVVDSRFGRVLRACAQNERRLMAIGIPAGPYKLTAFVISGAISGAAGALWAASQGFISPADMSWGRSGELVAMIVLGGMTVVWGPVVGAVVFLVLEMLLAEYTAYWQLPFGLALIAIVVFMQGGLAGLAAQWSRRSARKDAPHG
jgi:branched-chain amino acid transport system permease protein